MIETFFDHTPWADVPELSWPWAWHVPPQRAWAEAMAEVSGWLGRQGVAARDARVIVPVGAVLPLARRAWSAVQPGWMPVIDTVAGWAQQASWGHEPAADALDDGDWPPLTLHPITDRMHLRAAWARQGWASAWQRRDPRGHDHGLAKVVEMAHAVARRLQAVAPTDRAAWLDRALQQAGQRAPAVAGQPVPGARESLLQQWAVSWAGQAAARGLAGDALFGVRPAAVAMVVAGDTVAPGTEAHWALSLLAHWHRQGVPVLRLHARPEWGQAMSGEAPALITCSDAEDEAQQACAVVLQAVAAQRTMPEGAQPVAVLALDRSVVRRMRALLEGLGVALADETGWRLSTTRASAALTRLVRAARPDASTEDWLDWLKSGWLPPQIEHEGQWLDVPQATAELEAHCRRHQLLQPQGLPELSGPAALPPQAAAVCGWALRVLRPLTTRWSARGGRLADWLTATAGALQDSGGWEVLMADPAGQSAWLAICGDGPVGSDEAWSAPWDATSSGLSSGALSGDIGGSAWSGLAHKTRLDGHRFVRWINDVMEATTFRPGAPAQPDVVITTPARAVLRPFAAMVMPGAHLGQLGALDPVDPWLGGTLAQALDLPTPAARRAMQWEAWRLLLQQPGMCCLVRTGQGGEPMAPSPWLAQWADDTGLRWRSLDDPRPVMSVDAHHQGCPSPSVPAHRVPDRLTATAYEALRDCPYRYFAMHVLGLRAPDELEEGVDHADHGTWLHEVLRHFHLMRQQWPQPLSADESHALWLQCAQDVAQEQGLASDAARPYFAPYLADAPRLADAYLNWLGPHEAQGWAVHWMEQRVEAAMQSEGGAPLVLHGQIDRMDRVADGEGARHLLIDYKTGNLQRLKGRVRSPDEDTQLAFYAVLAQAHPTEQTTSAEVLEAAYLHVHRDNVTLVPHAEVAASADRLAQAISVDWQRLRAGQGFTALGEGPACAHCDHAGLCRKAHWPLLDDTDDAAPQQPHPEGGEA